MRRKIFPSTHPLVPSPCTFKNVNSARNTAERTLVIVCRKNG